MHTQRHGIVRDTKVANGKPLILLHSVIPYLIDLLNSTGPSVFQRVGEHVAPVGRCSLPSQTLLDSACRAPIFSGTN